MININSNTIEDDGRYNCYQSNLCFLSLLRLVVPIPWLAQELSTLDACLIYCYNQHDNEIKINLYIWIDGWMVDM